MAGQAQVRRAGGTVGSDGEASGQAWVRDAGPVQRLLPRQLEQQPLAQSKPRPGPGRWAQAVREVQLQVPVRRRHPVLQVVPVQRQQQVAAVPKHLSDLPQAV